ncbi:MAG: hypothetical protein O2800_05690 [Planctomycetota bacterium]|nr:hypothetical protein [Planctomycetota bacterium]
MHNFKWIASLLLCAGASVFTLTGCGEDEAPPPPPPAPVVELEPPPPPPPSVTSIKDLMKRLGISEKVQLAEDDAPDTDVERIAVLLFFDSFAKGDEKAAAKLMSTSDKRELAAIVKNGGWKSATESIDLIEVKTGTSPSGNPCALGIFAFATTDDQGGLWVYEATDSQTEFDAEITPPDVMDDLSGADPIGKWYELIARLLALADLPDEIVEIVQEDRTVAADTSDAPPASSGGSGGAPMRRKPVDAPIAPGGPPNPMAPSGAPGGEEP